MGSPVEEVFRTSNEGPVSVQLTQPFLLETAEVTQGQWRELSGGVNPARFSSSFGSSLAERPLERVSWWSALGYLNARSEAEGLSPCYELPASGCTGTWQEGTLDCGDRMPAVNGGDVYACVGYRLPTEAEWEYAARAGTTTATYAGNLSGNSGCVRLSGAGSFGAATWLADLAWYDCNTSSPRPARLRWANAWGLHDMLGNVWEWVWDRYDAEVQLTGGMNPQVTSTGPNRGVRGGGWSNWAVFLRVAGRAGWAPGSRQSHTGFRVARSLP